MPETKLQTIARHLESPIPLEADYLNEIREELGALMLKAESGPEAAEICRLEELIVLRLGIIAAAAFPTPRAERAALMHRALAGDRLLIIRVDRVYGLERIYPVNPAAHAIAQIAGTKTLRREDLAIARDALGFTIAEDPRPRLDLPKTSTVRP